MTVLAVGHNGNAVQSHSFVAKKGGEREGVQAGGLWAVKIFVYVTLS